MSLDTHARTGTMDTKRTAVLHRRSKCPGVVRQSARSTHTSTRVGCEGEMPTTYMRGSSAVVGGPTRRIPIFSELLLYRRLRAHTIYLCRRSLFYDGAISSIAAVHTRYCQGDPYHAVSSNTDEHEMIFSISLFYFTVVSSMRTRCIGQQQRSVASATLATTQQSVRNTTLRITPL